MVQTRTVALLSLAFVLVVACERAVSTTAAVGHKARQETVYDFASHIPEAKTTASTPEIQLERITTGVPWPRGLSYHDGKLVVLARGRHRRSGGVDHEIRDRCGCLYDVDPKISEPVVIGQAASPAVAKNARLAAHPDMSVFRLPDVTLEPSADYMMDRPYCTLIWDALSENYFIFGYSGVDLPGSKFRKNATDSIHRFDTRLSRWFNVERHDPSIVDMGDLGYVVSNEHYPHHDVTKNAAPHGQVNGPNGGCIVGRYLYVAAKDNHRVVAYDLETIRTNPHATPPESRVILGAHLKLKTADGVKQVEALGASALAERDGYLYVGYRTSSVVLRWKLLPDGALDIEGGAELIAAFEPWDRAKRRSGNLIDITFDSKGALYAALAESGRVWRIGVPDPKKPFYGNDQTGRTTTATPYVDLPSLTGKPKARCGNIVFDERDRLYLCSGNYDSDSKKLAGVIYRAVRKSP